MIPINNIQATTMLMKKIISRGIYTQLSQPEYYIAAIFEKSHYDSDAYNKMAKDAVQMVQNEFNIRPTLVERNALYEHHTLTYWEIHTHRPMEADKAEAINTMLDRHIQSLGHMNLYEVIRTNIWNWSIRKAGTNDTLLYSHSVELLDQNVEKGDTIKVSVDPSAFYGMESIEVIVKDIDKKLNKITLLYEAKEGPVTFLSISIEKDHWAHMYLKAASVEGTNYNNLISSYDYYPEIEGYENSYMQLIKVYFKECFTKQFNLLRQRIRKIASLNDQLTKYEESHDNIQS